MGFLGRLAAIGRQAVNRAIDVAEARLDGREAPALDPGTASAMQQLADYVRKSGQEFGQPIWSYDFPKEVLTKAIALAQKNADDEELRDPRGLFFDPFSIVEQSGWKERPSQASYMTLSAMAWRIPVIPPILQTRIAQVSRFTKRQSDPHKMGFKVRTRGKARPMKPFEEKEAYRLEQAILDCGTVEPGIGADKFGAFTSKLMWDSLVYDQMNFETIRDRRGKPARWIAYDASTIRLADTNELFLDKKSDDKIRTVQILDGQIIAEWRANEMAFVTRNPRSSVLSHGYGTSELEMMISTGTALLWAFQYNQRFFSQGTAPKGVLNLKGAVPSRHLASFRKHWYAMVSGVENAFRTPVVNADGGIEWINMQSSNRDMEFGEWMDFLIKLASSSYLIDPAEIGFKYGNENDRSLFESANEQKIVHSKDRGLTPLVGKYGDALNENIIFQINPDFQLDFLGLDALTPEQLAELNEKRVKSYMTLNEVRAEAQLHPIEHGDNPLDPNFLQYLQAKEMAETQQAAGEDEQPSDGDGASQQEDGQPTLAELLHSAAGKPSGPGTDVSKSMMLQYTI
jgi:phage portal protein BeeE